MPSTRFSGGPILELNRNGAQGSYASANASMVPTPGDARWIFEPARDVRVRDASEQASAGRIVRGRGAVPAAGDVVAPDVGGSR
ncbi:hypothetical protein [Nocardia carnea]|uniref:hypothetical protein n=1 Tax=Nocardia carnea TaxID=37328 RepID=UPI0024559727|nr:hypothetical protein [Nocardia carnea]